MFKPTETLSTKTPSAKIDYWADSMETYADSSNITKAKHSTQHAFMKTCVDDTFWNTVRDTIRDDALWASIAQNVKKPPLTVNVIDFDFFGFNVSIWVPWSTLGPKPYGTLVELFRFTRYVERNKVHFAPFLRFDSLKSLYSVS